MWIHPIKVVSYRHLKGFKPIQNLILLLFELNAQMCGTESNVVFTDSIMQQPVQGLIHN